MKLSIFFTLLASSYAFTPGYHHGNNNRNWKVHTKKTLANKPSSASMLLHVASPPTVETSAPSNPTKVPEMIDENVYNFNKFLIDTVYDIICLVYPVKGTKRDYARFFVLETVARV
jgi:hypothetical protein